VRKLVVGVIVLLALTLGIATSAPAAHKRTVFQCKKFPKDSSGRARCFDQLPGANCTHPLVVEKAHETNRGDHRDIGVTWAYTLYGETNALRTGLREVYSWYTTTRNVAICPYPEGVVYSVSKLLDESICRYNDKHEYSCTSEVDTKLTHYHSGPHEGFVNIDTKPIPVAESQSEHLTIKAYYIHPPWEKAR
jgi:hypothetical protein